MQNENSLSEMKYQFQELFDEILSDEVELNKLGVWIILYYKHFEDGLSKFQLSEFCLLIEDFFNDKITTTDQPLKNPDFPPKQKTN